MPKDDKTNWRDGAPKAAQAYDLDQQNSAYWLLAPILLLAAIIRLVFFQQSQADIFIRNLIIDAEFYDKWAQNILNGIQLSKEPFYQDPLYAYFLAGCYKLFGHNPNAVRLVQVVIDLGTLWILFLLGKRFFNVRVGLLAAGMGALYGPLIYYTALLDKTTLTAFFIALSLLFIRRARTVLSLPAFLLSGLISGLTATLRGNMLLVYAGIALWLAAKHQSAEAVKHKQVLHSLSFISGISLIIGLVALRNYVVSGDRVLITSNAGLNFFIGNNRYIVGNYVAPPFLRGIPEFEYADSKAMAERILGRPVASASAVSSFWMKQGLDFVFNEPLRWLRLTARKLFLAFNAFEIPETYCFDYFEQKYWGIGVSFVRFGFICPCGLWGALLLWRRRQTNELHILAATYTLSLLLLFVTSRYRAPLVLPMLIFAAWLADEIRNSWERQKWRDVASCLLPALLLTPLLSWQPDWMKSQVVLPGLATPHTVAGTVYLETLGSVDAAIRELELARDINRDDPEAHNSLGIVYERAGNDLMALKAFEAAFRLRPDNATYKRNYMKVRARQGRGARE